MASQLERHAAQLAALGSPVRLAILRQVVQGDPAGTPVGDIQQRLDIPWSTLSHHLDRLTAAGLLLSRPAGRIVLVPAGLRLSRPGRRLVLCRADYPTLRRPTDYLWQDCCRGG